MSVFDLHSRVIADYRDFVRSFFVIADDRRWKRAETETEEQLAGLTKHFPTPRDAATFILDQFPITRDKDEKAHGHYRTKDRILEIYDAMLTAQRTGRPYQTRLDPPPADPRVAHSPRETGRT